MNERMKAAITCQSGACNPLPISLALNEAIQECRTKDVEPSEDAAVFLILHQLVYLMTGHDLVVNQRMMDRYNKAVEEMVEQTAAAAEAAGYPG